MRFSLTMVRRYDVSTEDSMSFDPYYEWLGIPPDEQPADRYRLLGIRRFESNLKVIENAAERQLLLLKSFVQSRPRQNRRSMRARSSMNLCSLLTIFRQNAVMCSFCAGFMA